MKTRREFLRAGVLGAGAVSLGLFALARYNRWGEQTESPYGPLLPVADEVSGLPLLLLPEGFRYRTIQWAGDVLGDGAACPAAFDGMGVVYQRGSKICLVRNHELRESSGAIGPAAQSYDVTGGGTSTLVFDVELERVVDSWISLSGTLNNCAGGVTPWGTWLSCEEAPFSPDLDPLPLPDNQAHWNIENARKPHGYVFEVPANGLAAPVPIREMGQFYHEAAVVDPLTGTVYMTEDSQPKAGFYRYLPKVPGALARGGRLQMMVVNDGMDMRSNLPLGQGWPVGWVDIDDPEQGFAGKERYGRGVVTQGLAAGGSAFVALEGCIWDEDRLFFASKLGGSASAGCIFEYDPRVEEVKLIYQSPGHRHFSGPDNLVVSPRGNLVVCEDRVSLDTAGQSLAGISKDGGFHKFCMVDRRLEGSWRGHDLATTARTSEWAGTCFSADGKWLFANIYSPGVTVAITGPWDSHWM